MQIHQFGGAALGNLPQQAAGARPLAPTTSEPQAAVPALSPVAEKPKLAPSDEVEGLAGATSEPKEWTEAEIARIRAGEANGPDTGFGAQSASLTQLQTRQGLGVVSVGLANQAQQSMQALFK
jgi:hypothetical protein